MYLESAAGPLPYPARLDIDYPATLNRGTTFFRLFTAIPAIILNSLATYGLQWVAFGVALMLLFRRRYPRPWFDWVLYLQRYSTRVGAYALLLTDQYPSTTDTQAVHLDLDYPEDGTLHPLLPLVKWLLAIPHYIVLLFLGIALMVVTMLAWFLILIRGHYPRGLFDFTVGVNRWGLRVMAYILLLNTDRYPPFSLR